MTERTKEEQQTETDRNKGMPKCPVCHGTAGQQEHEAALGAWKRSQEGQQRENKNELDKLFCCKMCGQELKADSVWGNGDKEDNEDGELWMHFNEKPVQMVQSNILGLTPATKWRTNPKNESCERECKVLQQIQEESCCHQQPDWCTVMKDNSNDDQKNQTKVTQFQSNLP